MESVVVGMISQFHMTGCLVAPPSEFRSSDLFCFKDNIYIGTYFIHDDVSMTYEFDKV